MKTLLLLPLAPLLLAASVGRGDEATTTVDALIERAYANNRDLRLATIEIERAKNRLRWSGRLPNPELEISATDDGPGLDEGEAVYEVAFAQRFPVTSRLRAEKAVRRVEVLLAATEIAERKRDLAHEIETLAVELAATRAEADLQSRLAQLNREVVAFLEERARLGEVSSLEVTQAELTGKSLERAIRSEEKRVDTLDLQIKRLAGLDADERLPVAATLEVPGASPSDLPSLKDVLERRPDYLAALVRADVSRAELTLARAGRFEDVSVRLFVEREKSTDAPNGLERNTFAGVGFSIPLPLRQRNQEGIESARLDVEAADRTAEARAFAIESELAIAREELEATRELAREAAGEPLRLAEKNLTDFREAHQKGQASLLQVQRAQEQVLELEHAAIALRRDFHLARAALRHAAAGYPGLEISPSTPESP